jgi:hypothetical protein
MKLLLFFSLSFLFSFSFGSNDYTKGRVFNYWLTSGGSNSFVSINNLQTGAVLYSGPLLPPIGSNIYSTTFDSQNLMWFSILEIWNIFDYAIIGHRYNQATDTLTFAYNCTVTPQARCVMSDGSGFRVYLAYSNQVTLMNLNTCVETILISGVFNVAGSYSGPYSTCAYIPITNKIYWFEDSNGILQEVDLSTNATVRWNMSSNPDFLNDPYLAGYQNSLLWVGWNSNRVYSIALGGSSPVATYVYNNSALYNILFDVNSNPPAIVSASGFPAATVYNWTGSLIFTGTGQLAIPSGAVQGVGCAALYVPPLLTTTVQQLTTAQQTTQQQTTALQTTAQQITANQQSTSSIVITEEQTSSMEITTAVQQTTFSQHVSDGSILSASFLFGCIVFFLFHF